MTICRWVHGMSYRDDQRRTWHSNAIECQETVDSETTTFAWITDLKVDARTVEHIATKGGRHRWHIRSQQCASPLPVRAPLASRRRAFAAGKSHARLIPHGCTQSQPLFTLLRVR